MATMFLKDHIKCPKCDREMFPCEFDRSNKKISYKCISCEETSTFSFDDVKNESNTYDYFLLNDDGGVSWKCYRHGYCDDIIEGLFGLDFSKFVDLHCILCKNEKELDEEMEYANKEGNKKLVRMFSNLDEDQIAELADEVLYDGDLEECDGNYVEAFLLTFSNGLGDEYLSFDSFYGDLQDIIQDLFDMTIDENGYIDEND